MAVPDATILIAAFDSAHSRHRHAQDLLRGQVSLEIPTAVLSELTSVIRRGLKDRGGDGNRLARTLLAGLFGIRGVREQQAHDGPKARDLFDRLGDLSYTDAVAIVTAWGLGADLLTLDQDQEAVWRQGR